MAGGREIKTEQELINITETAKAAVKAPVAAYDAMQKQLDDVIDRSMAPPVTARTAI